MYNYDHFETDFFHFHSFEAKKTFSEIRVIVVKCNKNDVVKIRFRKLHIPYFLDQIETESNTLKFGNF